MLTKPAETLLVLRALAHSHILSNMQVHTLQTTQQIGQPVCLDYSQPRPCAHLIPITAEAILGKEPALWHLPEVILVHELAPCPLLAQPAEPVLAHCSSMRGRRDWLWGLEVEGRGGDVPERAGRAERARASGDEGLA